MFCENCGAEITLDESKCHQCGNDISHILEEHGGTRLTSNEDYSPTLSTANPTNSNINTNDAHAVSAIHRRRRTILWVGAVVLFGIIGFGGYYGTTHYLSNRASQNALLAAKSGNFSLAVADELRAKQWNSNNASLTAQLAVYNNALLAKNKIASADKFNHSQQYDQALKMLSDAKAILSDTKNALYTNLLSEIKNGTERANIGQIEQESSKSSDVTTVSSDYAQLEKFNDNFGKAAQKDVLNHFNSLITKEIQQKIKSDDFSDASQEVNSLSQVISSDTVLSNLGNEIKTAQTAYEQKQQQIEEQSLAQAANIANLNANPIQVANLSVNNDGLGDTVATGTIQNQGTNIIGNVELQIQFYDNTGTSVDTEYVGVQPDPMNPNGQSTFSISIPDLYNATHASVTYATWINE